MRWLPRRSAAKRRSNAGAGQEAFHTDDSPGAAEAWEWEHIDAQSCAGFSSEGSFSCHDMGDLDGMDPWPHCEEDAWQVDSKGLAVPAQCRMMGRPGPRLGPLLGQWADSLSHSVAATVAGAAEVTALASCCHPVGHLRAELAIQQGSGDKQWFTKFTEDPLELVASGCLSPVGWCCADGAASGCARASAASTWGEVVRESVADWMFALDE